MQEDSPHEQNFRNIAITLGLIAAAVTQIAGPAAAQTYVEASHAGAGRRCLLRDDRCADARGVRRRRYNSLSDYVRAIEGTP